jgi:micrococcal nuclease
MKSDQNVSRPLGVRSLLLIIIAVIMAISYFSFSAPPHRASRHAPTARPHPAPRPARYHGPARPGTTVHPRRIGALRPVVVGGTGTVVVHDTSGSSDVQVVPVPVEVPAQTDTAEETKTETPASTGETLHTAKSSASSGVPSDADDSMAKAPSYKVTGVEDNGLTIVVDVDGQETKVRMIGLAEPQDDAKDEDSTRGPMGRGGPRVPTEIFLNFLKNLLQGEEVYIVYDSMVEEQDEDGKYVAYVYRAPDGMLLNTEILRQGFGVVDPIYDFAEKETFEYYQSKAQQAEKGLWNKSRGPMRNGPAGKDPRRGPLGKPEGMRK